MSASQIGIPAGSAMAERCSNSQEIFVESNRQIEKIAVAIRDYQITTIMSPNNTRQVGEN